VLTLWVPDLCSGASVLRECVVHSGGAGAVQRPQAHYYADRAPRSSLKGDNRLFSSAALSAHPDGGAQGQLGPSRNKLSTPSCTAALRSALPQISVSPRTDPIPRRPNRRRERRRKWKSPDSRGAIVNAPCVTYCAWPDCDRRPATAGGKEGGRIVRDPVHRVVHHHHHQ